LELRFEKIQMIILIDCIYAQAPAREFFAA
jgi:hypothetical protein